MNELERFNAMLYCDFDLLEVLFQLSAFQDYMEHLERHLYWPKNIEYQSARKIIDGEELLSKIDEIEYKYSVVLPLRQRYSYAVQLTSILEWSMVKILQHHTGEIPENRKFKELLEQVTSRLDVCIEGKPYLYDLYKFRNKVSHANGYIREDEENEWKCNQACEIVSNFNERYLLLDMVKFRDCMNGTWSWVTRCCNSYNNAIHPTSG